MDNGSEEEGATVGKWTELTTVMRKEREDASNTSNLDCLEKMTAGVRGSQFKGTASDQGES